MSMNWLCILSVTNKAHQLSGFQNRVELLTMHNYTLGEGFILFSTLHGPGPGAGDTEENSPQHEQQWLCILSITNKIIQLSGFPNRVELLTMHNCTCILLTSRVTPEKGLPSPASWRYCRKLSTLWRCILPEVHQLSGF